MFNNIFGRKKESSDWSNGAVLPPPPAAGIGDLAQSAIGSFYSLFNSAARDEGLRLKALCSFRNSAAMAEHKWQLTAEKSENVEAKLQQMTDAYHAAPTQGKKNQLKTGIAMLGLERQSIAKQLDHQAKVMLVHSRLLGKFEELVPDPLQMSNGVVKATELAERLTVKAVQREHELDETLSRLSGIGLESSGESILGMNDEFVNTLINEFTLDGKKMGQNEAQLVGDRINKLEIRLTTK